MASTRCILQKSIPLFAIIVPFSVLAAHFSGYGILSVFITSLLLIISPIIFIFSKQIQVEDVKGEVLSHICDEQQDSSLLDEVCKTVQEVPVGKDEQRVSQAEKSSDVEEIDTETIYKQNALHQHDLCGNQIHGCLVGSSHHDLYSESESIDPSFSSEDSDNDWTYSCNFGQSPECSDDSISDEESLIEIAIPSGHYVCPKEPKFTLQQKYQNYSTETLLDQHGIVLEQFAKINEMNEEDNLIEIDLSMGSIKCSRFEIEA